MPEDIGVILQIDRGNRVYVALGKLIQDADGEYYAEQIFSSDPKEMPLPTRLRLAPKRLELIQEPEAGRPAIYIHRMILAVL